VPLRLVLRTQPRSVSARFWWWFQDAPTVDGRGTKFFVSFVSLV